MCRLMMTHAQGKVQPHNLIVGATCVTANAPLVAAAFCCFVFWTRQRLHMDAIGHPILGDHFYGTKESLALADRCLLHAHTLVLRHPTSGERTMFTAPCEF